MSHQDAGLYKSFAMVLGALVLFTLLIIVIANIFSPTTDYSNDPLIANSVKKQIEPVGRSNVRAAAEPAVEAEQEEAKTASTETASAETSTASSEDAAATDTTASATEDTASEAETAESSDTDADSSETSTEGEANVEAAQPDSSVDIPVKVRAVVATNCAGCHANGIKGAQRNDDTAAWQSLAEKGIEALTASVINGKGEMPSRAESSLDDTELQLAVQHMINKNLDGSQPTAKTETTGGNTESTEEPVATAETTDEAAEPAKMQEDPAVTDSAAAEAVIIPDNVKAAVDTLCAACHISGVGNAPKYGDKDAWATRMANGIDAVAASAIAGKGAMPARGGSKLTDEEIKLAIQYMVSK